VSQRNAPLQPGTRRRASETLGYTPPVRARRLSPAVNRRLVVALCFIGWVAGLLAVSTAFVDLGLGEPPWTARAGAAGLAVVYSLALTYRCGGRVRVWPVLVLLGGAATLATELSWLLSTVSVVTAVLASVLAVMLTRPAATIPRVIGELAVTVVVALSGTVAVAAWNAPVLYVRFNLAVLALAMAVTFGVVWGLGAGLHGMGRRGLLLVAGSAIAMAVILAYGTAVREYGSPMVMDNIDAVVQWMDENVGGVPRPAVFLVGLPALVWGISTRVERRQGWWMCAFAVVGPAVMTTSLASPMASLSYVGLSTLYSVLLGLALGLLLRRFDPGTPSRAGRRARRDVSTVAVRPEPSRFSRLT